MNNTTPTPGAPIMTPRPLPHLRPYRPSVETVQQYGARALRFMLATENRGIVDSHGLESAILAARYALAAPDLSTIGSNRINGAVHVCGAILRARRQLDQQAEQTPTVPQVPAVPVRTSPDDGGRAVLRPTPPIPRPPAPTFANSRPILAPDF